MNNKITAAIIGYGNIGQYALEALEASADFEIAGIVRRKVNADDTKNQPYPVVDSVDKLGKVDVALLCVPTRSVSEYAEEMLKKGINTVDSFDVHQEIYPLKKKLDKLAKEQQCVSVIAAGWDPGSDSIIRALMLAMAPKGITYTNFGPGISMGHSVAVRSIAGIKDALSLTIPVGTGIHRRVVYIELDGSQPFAVVEKNIKEDAYFCHDETVVKEVASVNELRDLGHGVHLTHKGVSGNTHNQLFEYSMRINNPALTAQFMVSAARATLKQVPGAYTTIEIPLINYLAGDEEALIKQLV